MGRLLSRIRTLLCSFVFLIYFSCLLLLFISAPVYPLVGMMAEEEWGRVAKSRKTPGSQPNDVQVSRRIGQKFNLIAQLGQVATVTGQVVTLLEKANKNKTIKQTNVQILMTIDSQAKGELNLLQCLLCFTGPCTFMPIFGLCCSSCSAGTPPRAQNTRRRRPRQTRQKRTRTGFTSWSTKEQVQRSIMRSD